MRPLNIKYILWKKWLIGGPERFCQSSLQKTFDCRLYITDRDIFFVKQIWDSTLIHGNQKFHFIQWLHFIMATSKSTYISTVFRIFSKNQGHLHIFFLKYFWTRYSFKVPSWGIPFDASESEHLRFWLSNCFKLMPHHNSFELNKYKRYITWKSVSPDT